MEGVLNIIIKMVLTMIICLNICIGDFQIGTIYQDTYRKADVIAIYDKMGFKMCGRYCNRHSPCTAINYNPQILVCELLHAGGSSKKKIGIISSDLTTWNMVRLHFLLKTFD